jgi:hypothetical protein
MGKSTITGPFSIAFNSYVTNYQRVDVEKPQPNVGSRGSPSATSDVA